MLVVEYSKEVHVRIRHIFIFTSFLICVFAINQIMIFTRVISLGNSYLQIGLYAIIGLLGFKHLVLPVIFYMSTPTQQKLYDMLSGNKKNDRMIIKHYNKILASKDKEALRNAQLSGRDEMVLWIKNYNQGLVKEMDGIIRQYAFRTTVSVLVSPNAFIDGLSILYGNAKMTQQLIKKVGFRPTFNELIMIYTSIITVAGASGLIEEFDDAIEELAESFIEEFSHYFEEKSGENIAQTIPGLNVMVKSISPILQAAGNYAFMVYQGYRFKYTFLAIVSDSPQTVQEILKRSRKEARRARFIFIDTMLKKLGKGGMDMIKSKFKIKSQKSGGK